MLGRAASEKLRKVLKKVTFIITFYRFGYYKNTVLIF